MSQTVVAPTWAQKNKNLIFWISLGILVLISIIILVSVFSSDTNQETPGAGWFFLKSLLLILVGISYASRANRRLPYFFGSMAIVVFIVIINKFNDLFTWSVIGLPFFASGGIWMMANLDPKVSGRMRSFLGFASGIIIIFWMYMFYQTHPIENTDFIKTFFPDAIAICIFIVFMALFAFATWKNSFWFYTASFFVFLSFLGGATDFENGTVFDEIINRFPEQLTPNISEETKKTSDNVWEALLNKINKEIKASQSENNKNDKQEKPDSTATDTVETTKSAEEWKKVGTGIIILSDLRNPTNLSELGLPEGFPPFGKELRVVRRGDNPNSKEVVPGLYAKFIDENGEYIKMDLSCEIFFLDNPNIKLYAIGSSEKLLEVCLYWRNKA